MEKQRRTSSVPHPRVLAASLLLCMLPTSMLAQQQATARAISSGSLPYAPLPNLGPENSGQPVHPAEGSASVAGTVLDVSGASVSGAEVSLTHEDGTRSNTMVSESNGEFNFARILLGSYLVIVNAEGFAPFASAEFVVRAQQEIGRAHV